MRVAPLLAIDLESLLPFLFVAFWIVSQVFAAIRRVGGAGGGPAAGRPRPPAVPPRQPADGEDARREMARQIEEFLRQASGQERPAARPPQRPRPQLPGGQPGPQRGGQPPRRVPAGRPAPPVATKPGTAKPGGAKPAADAPHKLEPTVGTAPITSLKPSLADRDAAGRGRETVEKHVREAFSKDLPHLAADAADESQRPAAPTVADSLVRKLRDPATIRELILVREVLERPVDRW